MNLGHSLCVLRKSGEVCAATCFQRRPQRMAQYQAAVDCPL